VVRTGWRGGRGRLVGGQGAIGASGRGRLGRRRAGPIRATGRGGRARAAPGRKTPLWRLSHEQSPIVGSKQPFYVPCATDGDSGATCAPSSPTIDPRPHVAPSVFGTGSQTSFWCLAFPRRRHAERSSVSPAVVMPSVGSGGAATGEEAGDRAEQAARPEQGPVRTPAMGSCRSPRSRSSGFPPLPKTAWAMRSPPSATSSS
jgi:hypothetical protein